jgi:hypothetical protein
MDDDAGAESGDGSESVSSSEEDEARLGRGADTTAHGGRRGFDGGDWLLDPDDSPDARDGLYSAIWLPDTVQGNSVSITNRK